jgi:hypothetical protein
MLFEEILQFCGRTKSSRGPRRRTEPTADASNSSPKTPSSELSENKPTAWLEHAHDLGDRAIHLADETQDRHGDDAIERFAWERQRLGAPTHEIERGRFTLFSRACCVEHSSIHVERSNSCAAMGQRGGKSAVSATDIEHVELIDRAQKVEQKLLLKPVGDLAEPAAAPVRVGFREATDECLIV